MPVTKEWVPAAVGDTANARGGSILVVDDNELNRDLLSRRLKRSGYRVQTANSGADAISFLDREMVDVVLLDIEMPELSGLDVLRLLRVKHNALELPIIMVTALAESESVVEALDIGANDYVTKPVDFAVALARIRIQVTLKRTEEARRQSEERYALAIDGSNDGIWDWDLLNNTVFYSTRWKTMLGYDSDEIQPTLEEWLSKIHPEDREPLEANLNAHIEGTDSQFKCEHRMLHRNGSYRWVLTRGIAVRDEAGRVHRIAGSQSDITSGKVTCPLTGLPNRLLFVDRLGRLLERSKRKKDFKFAVLFIDFDRFKLVNDSLGHLVGDKFLIAAGRRMERELRSTDTISPLDEEATLARLGGDEFTVLLDSINDWSDALAVGERLIESMQKPLNIEGHEIFPSISIGIATGAASYESAEDILRDADTAMYRAKTLGRNRVEIFDAEMRAGMMARLQLETELRYATERNEIKNEYQPIVSLVDGRINGFEALVRWHPPSLGIIPPDKFIPVAEDTGAILSIGKWVLYEACRQLRVWQQSHASHQFLRIAVNVSARQFTQGDLLDQVREAIEITCIQPSNLTLEITESTLMHNVVTAKSICRTLKSLGVRIGIDDFGTGYSSFSHLHSFPFDTLKIDRSFVSHMEHDAQKREIVRTTVALAHNLGLDVVAEGVETREQMVLLRDLGCEYGQGFHFSRPLNSVAAGELIAATPVWFEEYR